MKLSTRSNLVLTGILTDGMRAGIPINRLIDSFADFFTGRKQRRLRSLAGSLESGVKWDTACLENSIRFHPLIDSLIRTYDAGDPIVNCLNRIERMLDHEDDLKCHLNSMFLYPILLWIATLVVSLLLLNTFFPVMDDLFSLNPQGLPFFSLPGWIVYLALGSVLTFILLILPAKTAILIRHHRHIWGSVLVQHIRHGVRQGKRIDETIETTLNLFPRIYRTRIRSWIHTRPDVRKWKGCLSPALTWLVNHAGSKTVLADALSRLEDHLLLEADILYMRSRETLPILALVLMGLIVGAFIIGVFYVYFEGIATFFPLGN